MSNKPMVPTAHASPTTNPPRPLRRHIGQPLDGEGNSSMPTEVIEAAFAAMDRNRIPTSGAPGQGDLDDLRTCLGDFGLALAYAALFSPDIRLDGGCPMGRFASEKDDVPLDTVHVDLLHHCAAPDRDPAVFRALGEALAQFWNFRLMAAHIPGRFRYRDEEGFDVVYEPV